MAPLHSSAELGAVVCADPRPLIFVDTAAILDILRIPFRLELQADIVNAAAEIVEDASTADPMLWIVSTVNVRREYQANQEAVLQELRSSLHRMEQSFARLHGLAHAVVPERRIHPFEWFDETLQLRVLQIVDRLVDSIHFFSGSDESIVRANSRLWAGIPPARRSKQEFKDCLIFEEFLEFARILRGRGFSQTMNFVTSNTSDYGKPPTGHLAIQHDLAQIGARFTGNLAWALATLRGEGQSFSFTDEK